MFQRLLKLCHSTLYHLLLCLSHNGLSYLHCVDLWLVVFLTCKCVWICSFNISWHFIWYIINKKCSLLKSGFVHCLKQTIKTLIDSASRIELYYLNSHHHNIMCPHTTADPFTEAIIIDLAFWKAQSPWGTYYKFGIQWSEDGTNVL